MSNTPLGQFMSGTFQCSNVKSALSGLNSDRICGHVLPPLRPRHFKSHSTPFHRTPVNASRDNDDDQTTNRKYSNSHSALRWIEIVFRNSRHRRTRPPLFKSASSDVRSCGTSIASGANIPISPKDRRRRRYICRRCCYSIHLYRGIQITGLI